MVKKFIKSTRLTSKRPSVAFTPQGKEFIEKRVLKEYNKNQGINKRNTQNIHLNNRAVPLNPNFKGKPRAGTFGTKRLAGF